MINNSYSCESWPYILTNLCNTDPYWTSQRYCQQSCFDGGRGYPGDICQAWCFGCKVPPVQSAGGAVTYKMSGVRHCASMGSPCWCEGTVYYGKRFLSATHPLLPSSFHQMTAAGESYEQSSSAGSTVCSHDGASPGFSSDPAVGFDRHCYCVSTPTMTPLPTPSPTPSSTQSLTPSPTPLPTPSPVFVYGVADTNDCQDGDVKIISEAECVAATSELSGGSAVY